MINMSKKRDFGQNCLRNEFEERTKNNEGIKSHLYEQLSSFEKERQRQSIDNAIIVHRELSKDSAQFLYVDKPELKKGLYVVFTTDAMIISKIDSSATPSPQKIIRICSEKDNGHDIIKLGAYFTWLNSEYGSTNKEQPLQRDTLQNLFKKIFS